MELDQNTIRILFDAGLLKEKFADYQRLFFRHQELVDGGMKSHEAAIQTGSELGASKVTIYRAIKIYIQG